MTGLFWALLTLVLAISLLVLEMFIPSGGLLGVMAAAGFIASVVFVFRESSTWGFFYLVGIAVALPAGLMAMVKYWPHTTIGRMMLNLPPPGTEPEPVYNPWEDLIGKQGVAKSKMLPSGAIVIEGRTYDAVSTGTAIEPGDAIEVYRVEGNRITVRLILQDAKVHPSNKNTGAEPSSNVLERTYDDVIADPFDEPLP